MNGHMQVRLLWLLVLVALGATLTIVVGVVAVRARETAARVDRNTVIIQRQVRQNAAIRRAFIRRGFYINCAAVRELARDHPHGETGRLKRLDCERLRREFVEATRVR